MLECCCCFPDVNVETLLVENEKVLRLLRSEILQTEIRLLYELIYVLNNSYRGNKTFKGLKQVRSADKTNAPDHCRTCDSGSVLFLVMENVSVFQDSKVRQVELTKSEESTHSMCPYLYYLQVEQCINRLKIMKLDDALQELMELCPSRIQR